MLMKLNFAKNWNNGFSHWSIQTVLWTNHNTDSIETTNWTKITLKLYYNKKKIKVEYYTFRPHYFPKSKPNHKCQSPNPDISELSGNTQIDDNHEWKLKHPEDIKFSDPSPLFIQAPCLHYTQHHLCWHDVIT